MIGNDVIDLKCAHAESNWQRRGFLQKIFTPDEQDFIRNASDSEIAVWKLWSQKEAVYKIINRATGIRRYNPLQIECLAFGNPVGNFRFQSQRFTTQTTVDNLMIHTIAVTHANQLGEICIIPSDNLIKENGLPFFKDPISNQLHPASKSHHGDYQLAVTLMSEYPI